MTDEYDAGLQEHVDSIASFDKNWDQQLINDLASMMRTASGRRVVWSILEQCGIHTPFPSDQVEMLKASGRRELGLDLREWILTSDNDGYTLMRNEHLNRMKIRKELLDG